MADKRIRELDALGILTGSHKLGVDLTGLSEAKSITVTQLSSFLGVRAGKTSLSKDTGTTVTFPSPFSDTNYALAVTGYDANGNMVAVNVSNRTANGFNATPADNCTLNYLAYETTAP